MILIVKENDYHLYYATLYKPGHAQEKKKAHREEFEAEG